MMIISEECRGLWGRKDFISELADEISQNGTELPLDEYCRHGGWPDFWVEIRNLECKVDGQNAKLVRGRFETSFTESYHSGCRDMEWDVNHEGSISFVLDMISGELEITDSHFDQVPDEEVSEPTDEDAVNG